MFTCAQFQQQVCEDPWKGEQGAPPEDDGVVLPVQVALVGQQVQAEESVVAPTFPNLKIRGKLPDDVFGGIVGGLVNHFYTVFIPGEGKVTGIRAKRWQNCSVV